MQISPAGARRQLGIVRDHDQRRLRASLEQELEHRSPAAASRLPVGSSAKSTLGRVIVARARATRCISPPESWDGIVPGTIAEPHPFQQLAARRAIAASPSNSAGTRTFSNAVKVGMS